MFFLVIVILVFGVVSFVIGGYVGQTRERSRYGERLSQQKETAEARMLELQQQQRDALRESKDETARIRTALEEEGRERRQEIKRQELRLQQKEEQLDHKT